MENQTESFKNTLDWLLEPDNIGVRYLALRALRVLSMV
jgi:hypothetical protein